MSAVTRFSATPQHVEALASANRVRLARAELKRRIAADRLTASEVIESRPWQAETMTISELLESQHRWGKTRSRRLLVSLKLPETKRIGTLTDRQAVVLAAALAPID